VTAAAGVAAAVSNDTTSTAAPTCLAGDVVTWDFRPDGQLPKGRPSTGCSMADKLAAAAAANTAARVAAAKARSEAAAARTKATGGRQSQGSRGRGRSGRGRSSMPGTSTLQVTNACEEGPPRLGPDDGELRTVADDEQQPPVAQQEEDTNQEKPLQATQREMATGTDMDQVEQHSGPENVDSAADRTSSAQGADASCAAS